MMWGVLSSVARLLPPEPAHMLAVRSLRAGLGPRPKLTSLPASLGPLALNSPIGLAAGFDKHAHAVHGALRLGFGFVEIGTVTPRPQPGNPRPRLFRLPEDRAVINRFGFNSPGMDVVARYLTQTRKTQAAGPVGVNIGANKNSDDQIEDYFLAARRLSNFADYLTVNLSSPNTPGLRRLQHDDNLKKTLAATKAGQSEAGTSHPVFVKLAPDLEAEELYRILDGGLEGGADGFILTNTTIDRPSSLQSVFRAETGGLSGAPLRHKSLEILAMARQHLHAQGLQHVPLVGVGGISSASDILARIAAGACAVQLYTALALYGPHLIARMHQQLVQILKAEKTDIASLCGQIPNADEARHYAQSRAEAAGVFQAETPALHNRKTGTG